MSRFKRLNPLAAVADQAWLSLLSFAISLAFIWGATKAEYGYYLLLLAPLLLIQSIQNAIVNSPLATFLPAADEAGKTRIRTTAATLHIYLALACAVLGLAGLQVYGWLAHFHVSALLLAGFTLAIIGTIARESQRSFAYVQGQGMRALASDLVYGSILLAGIGLAIAGSSLSAGIVLALTGIAGIAPMLLKLGKFEGLQTHADPIKQFWSCGRWALPSVIVTWVNLGSYPYFAGKALGISTVADIGAARLFLMPIGLMMTAWANWYRPRISRLFAAGDVNAIKRITHTSLLVGLAIMALLAVFFLVAYPFLERFLGPQYQGLQPVVLMWLLFFTISLARNFYMATLMIDANGYKILHHITWLALALSLPGFILLSANGALWVVGVLCAVELVQLIMVVTKARQYWSRPKAET
jgi:O-antigen/teichoic acid export membrane protein